VKLFDSNGLSGKDTPLGARHRMPCFQANDEKNHSDGENFHPDSEIFGLESGIGGGQSR
jgi:myo-inositol-hexaphosphate 3-phosphohydrolase